jgi:hypothetical protein
VGPLHLFYNVSVRVAVVTTDWSLVQRSPTACVIKKPQMGSQDPIWAVEPLDEMMMSGGGIRRVSNSEVPSYHIQK